MYLLDTNVVSELRKNRPHGAVIAWLEGIPDSELFVSAMTLGEIQAGIEMTREQDAPKAASIEAWADELAASYNVLPVDIATFRLWAKLKHRKPDALFQDALIAACAMVHNLTLVTRNVRDFEAFNVIVLNPFSERQA